MGSTHDLLYGLFQYEKLVLQQFEPKLQLDHALPERLKLLPIEEDIFYILHFVCYGFAHLYGNVYCNTYMWDKAIYDLSWGKTNRHEIAQEIKENLCQKILNVDCTAIPMLSTKNIPTWKDCHRNDTSSMHQSWCKDCKNLSECVYPNLTWDNDFFLRLIVNTFYTWRKYHNKRNILDISISQYLKNDKEQFNKEVPKYMKTFNLFPEQNLTLLDAWAYANLEIIQDVDVLVGIDTKPIIALRSCINNQSNESCHLVDRFSKDIGIDNKKIWKTFYEKIHDGLIPLCSYASEDYVLHTCKNFKKMINGNCFTFNESSFDHTLGLNQGLNFVVNYNNPGTITDLSKPIRIMLHEPSQIPDIKNIMGMNFRAAPGHIIDLKISATIINSTEAFDAMNFNSRLCNEDIENGEINCISDKINDWAIGNCGCQPWYLSNPQIKTCDT